jgi:hypothetical protein
MLALLAALALSQLPPGPADAPTPPPAAAPKARPAAPRPPPAPAPRAEASGPLRGDWPTQPSGKSVTLEDTDTLDDTLEQIAEAAGWNVVLNTGRTGNVHLVLRLRQVPVEEALRSALEGTGLVATRRGLTVVVAPGEAAPAAAQDTLSGFDRPTGKTVTLDLVETPVADALRKIADAAGVSIVLPPGDHGRITAQFRKTPAEDALRSVLEQAGLVAAKRGNIVTVSPGDRFARLRGRGFPIPPDLDRQIEEGMRHAEIGMRRAERDMRRVDRAGRGVGSGPHFGDRVVNGDVTVHVGEDVRDVVAIRGNVKLEPGSEARDVVAVLGSVELGPGATAREAVAVGGDVSAGPGATIEHDAVSVGGRIKLDPNAEIGGQQTAVGLPEITGLSGLVGAIPFARQGAGPWFSVAMTIVKFVVYFLIGLLVVTLFPRRVDGVSTAMTAHPFKSVLVGLLGIFASALASVLLVATLIGAPLVAVVVVGVLAAGVLGFVSLSFHVGRMLPIHTERRLTVLQLAAGTAIFVLVTQVPFLGWLVWIAAALLTFGAVLRSRFGGEPPVLPTTVVSPPASDQPA